MRCYRHCFNGSALPTVCGATATVFYGSALPAVCGSTAADLMARRCRSCAVLPPLTLNAGSNPIPSSETGHVHVACGPRVTSPVTLREPRRSVRRRCPLQHPFSSCRRGSGVAGAPASNDGTLWCGLPQLAFHCHLSARVLWVVTASDTRSQESGLRAQTRCMRSGFACWSPWWGAGPLSGALLGDGASFVCTSAL